jgi:signal transduction histidine kinase
MVRFCSLFASGERVPEQAIERLGAPFFRVDESRSESTGGGMGLGLAIARRAMHLHDGTLVTENASPGLRIILSLPAATV